MQSKFAIAGHPIHPALVAVPIGLFLWTFVADIVYLASDRDQTWYDIAYWTGLAAVISGAVAALPGFGDYYTVAKHSDARDMAVGHMILNLTVVGGYFVAFLLMIDNNARDGVALGTVIVIHAVGLRLLGLSGWLGGEMVYRHHLAMVSDDAEMERGEQARHIGGAPARGHGR
jgi:uncharacterized membrane protein